MELIYKVKYFWTVDLFNCLIYCFSCVAETYAISKSMLEGIDNI